MFNTVHKPLTLLGDVPHVDRGIDRMTKQKRERKSIGYGE